MMSGAASSISKQTGESSHRFKYGSPHATVSLPTLNDIRNSLGEVRAVLESTDHVIAEYIQIQKMESVGYLARELGHDLRNGLMALAGKLFQLQRVLPNEEAQGRIEDILCILKNLEGMIGRLQSLGQDEYSEEESVPQDFSRESARVIRIMRSSLGAGMHLQYESSPEPLNVMLCKGDVWRILSNLLLNARDAMPHGGRIQVRIGGRHVDAEYCRNHGNAHPGHFASLSVEDEGVGISPEILPRIFDPLFTTKSSSQDAQKRGWGLAIVYTLVRRRGGWIDVESQIEEGTRFEVFLPVHRSSETS
ncbi:ATP-binding protein [Desulforhabdus amnigena]|uniref:histidine kinase n=1 Tax=Desulforhabdus amnigena TaxID=40218 RepID=A0A9W6D4D6_9BACT|nr:ATP-binding protein [Desulforhabdus amnigena]NLJ27319.1 hypothetical protein [Deltaproteobacteria bacterium]GLI34674.1 hypothetical protein DAMNIGENAA_21070 [Desulforhabdus amnigena]